MSPTRKVVLTAALLVSGCVRAGFDSSLAGEQPTADQRVRDGGSSDLDTGSADGSPDVCQTVQGSNGCLPQPGCTVPASCKDVVLSLHFDNTAEWNESATRAHDFTGRGNDATCIPAECPVWTASGRHGGAFVFNGSQRFEIKNAPSLSITGEVTVAAWFRPQTLEANWRPMVSKAQLNPELSNYWLGHNGDTFWFVYKPDGQLDWVKPLASPSQATGQWYHLVGIKDDGANLLQLYVNGAPYQKTGVTQKLVADAGSLWIGWGPGDDHVTGVIDEVTIWNRRLSQAEVMTLYNQ